ncbi:ERCC4 domain-containing protein [Clostridium sp.]|uniref:ERCC4 domain-containing protein n=1 Tax=Clostridium sp. TaxID=1506 RepID=UPI001DAFA163|nr:ERCC4 domain-containing protein [Clostridium sp.]MBS5307673.1 ERCC4 domain-containing protein [Clostridium sp.]
MTDTQIKKIFKESTYIIIDTREKDSYIKDTFDKFGIKYKVKKLNYGDYSIEIDKNEELGITEDMKFSIAIERKGSLEEISGNLTKGQKRFYNEMQRCIDDEGFMVIMIEDATYGDVISSNYKTNLTSKQLLGLLHGVTAKYQVPFIFVPKDNAPLFVYNMLKYHAREYLKNINNN